MQWWGSPNQSLRLTGHAMDACARLDATSRVSRQVSLVFGHLADAKW
jgi:hypothetical protein